MKFRVEQDPMGKKKVPANVLYGVHTQRAKENFKISGHTLPLALFHAIAEIKMATAHANAQLGLLEKKKASVIIRAAQEIVRGMHDKEFVVDAFQAGEGTPTHMNVNEVIANRAIELLHGRKGNYRLIHPNDDVNMGQSTNNVVPSAIKMVALRRLDTLVDVLVELESVLLKKSKEFTSIIKSGRTHLQDAVPITLGQEFHAYATSMGYNCARIERVMNALLVLNVGRNAIGTGVNTHPRFTPLVIKQLKKMQKLPWREAKDHIFATQNVTVFLEVSEVLKLVAVDLNKMVNDVRLLSSGPHTGLAEISLPIVEPGSSIMPGKVNPSIPEMVNMVCYQVFGNDTTITAAEQAGQLELNVMLPLIAKNLLESIALLNNAVHTLTEKCVRGIKANKDVCKYYAEHTAGLATLLNPYLGYDKAAQVVKESLKTGKSVKDIVLKKRLLTETELEVIFDYKHATQPNVRKAFKKRK